VRQAWLMMSIACVLAPAVGLGAAGAAAPKPSAKPTPARPAPGAAAVPRTPAPPAGITAVNLAPTLRALGYMPAPNGGYHRLRVEEDKYGYFIDVGMSPSGDWVMAMAHLATVPDLTKVPSAPLLALLGANDALLGMAFSYDRVNGRIMLNASAPARSLAPGSLKNMVEGLQATVKRSEGLWDTAQW